MPTSTGRLDFAIQRNERPVPDDERAAVLADPGFGVTFTDHMVTATWTPAAGWHDAAVRPYASIPLDPATAVLHYAQSIFEGLKAYRHADGSVWTFRPDQNAARFARSARRLALPELPAEDFLASIDVLVRTDREWVPTGGEASLYLRPFMFASESFLGVRPAKQVTYCLIASPAGAYFAKGVKPVSIWLSRDYTRAAPGGTGAAKCAGNYAASLLPQQEALEHGCDQVCFLDAVERRWVEELGGMNLYFVHDDGSIVTPELTGTILEGVTRGSILQLAGDLGFKVEERKVEIDEWRDGVRTGRITEVFACGTAAVVTPIGRLAWNGGELLMAGDEPGPVTSTIRRSLLDIQYGRSEDLHGWMHRIT
ncbi:MAG TPA: branched-chain amino acid aminotransferase [Jiangellales bacterium]|nr:branched-chain amino acid aminotransferase [Jiangellales bacterium]